MKRLALSMLLSLLLVSLGYAVTHVPEKDVLQYQLPVNVKFYGALGDNGSDDTTAINTAKTAAGIAGELYFPPGIYITTGLTISTGQTWTLDDKATIKLKANATKKLLNIASSNVKVIGGAFDGNKASQTDSNATISIATGLSDITIQGTHIKNSKAENISSPAWSTATRIHILDNTLESADSDAITLWGTQYSEIRGNQVLSSGRNGITVDSNPINTTISDNHIYSGVPRMGIEIWYSSDYVTVSGNEVVINGNDTDASWGISVPGALNCNVTNNSIRFLASSVGYEIGLELPAISNCTVSGNVIVNTGFPLSLTEACYSTISNNVIKGATVTIPWPYGLPSAIYLGSSTTNSSKYNLISGNTIDLTGTKWVAGILLQCNNAAADCSNNMIVNNLIIGDNDTTGNALWTERDAGTMNGTSVIGNTVKSWLCGMWKGTFVGGTYSRFYLNKYVDVTYPVCGYTDTTDITAEDIILQDNATLISRTGGKATEVPTTHALASMITAPNPWTLVDVNIWSDSTWVNNYETLGIGHGLYWDSATQKYIITDTTGNQASFTNSNGNFIWSTHIGALSSPQTYIQWHSYDKMWLSPTGLAIGSNDTQAGLHIFLNDSAHSALLLEQGNNKPAFGIFPWDQWVGLSAGTYFNGGWQHFSDDNNSQMMAMWPLYGFIWYASNNRSASWNVANGVKLWDNTGTWTAPSQASSYKDIGGYPLYAIRNTPSPGYIVKWNAGGYAEWVAP